MITHPNDIEHFQLKGPVKAAHESSFLLIDKSPFKILRDEDFLSFNSKGKLISQQFIEFSMLHHFEYETGFHFLYDEQNRLYESYSLNIKNILLTRSLFKFINEELTEIKQFSNSNSLEKTLLIFTDYKLFQESEEEFSPKFELVTKTERKYDKKLDIISEKKFDPHNHLISSYFNIKNNKGKIIRSIIENNDGKHLEFQHDYSNFNNNFLKEHISVFKNDKFQEEWIKWYDESGCMVKQETFCKGYIRVETFCYPKKDNYLNWTEKKITSSSNDGEINLLIIRKIDYFCI